MDKQQGAIMSFCNTENRYGFVTKFLHWLVMLLVIGMLTVGTFMGDIESKDLKGQVYMLHKSTGLIILTLGILFILWSTMNRKPKYPIDMPCREKCLARTVHVLLYVLLVAMPLSGWIMSSAAGYYPNFFGQFEVPMPFIPVLKPLSQTAKDFHYYFAWSFAGLIGLHAIGALKHHFIDKNDLMKRMLG